VCLHVWRYHSIDWSLCLFNPQYSFILGFFCLICKSLVTDCQPLLHAAAAAAAASDDDDDD